MWISYATSRVKRNFLTENIGYGRDWERNLSRVAGEFLLSRHVMGVNRFSGE